MVTQAAANGEARPDSFCEPPKSAPSCASLLGSDIELSTRQFQELGDNNMAGHGTMVRQAATDAPAVRDMTDRIVR